MHIVYDVASYKGAPNAINRPYLHEKMQEFLGGMEHNIIKGVGYATGGNNLLITTIEGFDNYLIEVEENVARIVSIDCDNGEKELLSVVIVEKNEDDFEQKFTQFAFQTIHNLL
ncbi:hypothetical protein QPI79_002977 [Enterococcus faecalis]|nr:hypothetical protein [Enterococcus faecalis]